MGHKGHVSNILDANLTFFCFQGQTTTCWKKILFYAHVYGHLDSGDKPDWWLRALGKKMPYPQTRLWIHLSQSLSERKKGGGTSKKKRERWCSTDKTATGQQACITEGGWEIIGQLVGEHTPLERQFWQRTQMDRWMERKTSSPRASEGLEGCDVTPRRDGGFSITLGRRGDLWPAGFSLLFSFSCSDVVYEGELNAFRRLRAFW